MRFVMALGAVALLAATVLVFGGGRELNALGTEDVRADMLNLQVDDPCTFQSLAGDLVMGPGIGIPMTITDSDVVSSATGCQRNMPTDPDDPEPCLDPTSEQPWVRCYLQGESYFRLEANNPYNGCIQLDFAGRRKGVWYGIAGETVLPPVYSDPTTGATEKICGVESGDTVELVWMTCPDVTGAHWPDNRVDMMNDIFGIVFAYGAQPGDFQWRILADVNEDGIVDLMNDLFFVIERFGLNCDDFPLAAD